MRRLEGRRDRVGLRLRIADCGLQIAGCDCRWLITERHLEAASHPPDPPVVRERQPPARRTDRKPDRAGRPSAADGSRRAGARGQPRPRAGSMRLTEGHRAACARANDPDAPGQGWSHITTARPGPSPTRAADTSTGSRTRSSPRRACHPSRVRSSRLRIRPACW
jgi:hypothetical protein